MKNTHITLIGDSIFDNSPYTRGEPDVVSRLRELMPDDWKATLCAVDGHTTSGIKDQLNRVPNGTTHLALSIGGNDALGVSSILNNRAVNIAQALIEVDSVIATFANNYKQMLSYVLNKKLPTVVCTIYNPRYSDPAQQKACVAALRHFNDVIIREAMFARLPIIDLRSICTGDSDYANPIEPSSTGGKKIAAKIIEVVQQHDWTKNTSLYF